MNEKIKYVIVAQTFDGNNFDAKVCFTVEDLDFWLGYFKVIDADYTTLMTKVNRSGVGYFSSNYRKSNIKVMTFDHIAKNSISYRY